MVIEFVSLIIRPVTLRVRLLANIRVGHLLLSLRGMFGLIIRFGSIIGFLVVRLLCLLEIVTAFMQAYVFVLLGWVYIIEN